MNKEKTPLLSIIIPVYNSEKYIKECINSIVTQKSHNYELIIVDDGSTDNTPTICQQFSKEFSCVKYFRTPNQGVSGTRNMGIEKSRGSYIWFVDSDDKIVREAISSILNKLDDCDCLIFGFAKFSKNNSKILKYQNTIIKSQTAINRALSDNDFRGYLHNKIFKSDIIKKNHLSLDPKIKTCEDLLFCVQYFSICNKIKIIDNVLYMYRQRKSSAVHQSINKDQATAIIAFYKIIELCNKNQQAKTKAEALFMRAFYKYKPIIDAPELKKYKRLLKQMNTNPLKLPKKDLMIISGYRFLNPIMRKIQKNINNQEGLYD